MSNASWRNDLATRGFAVLPAVFSVERIESILFSLDTAFRSDADGSTLRGSDGSVYTEQVPSAR